MYEAICRLALLEEDTQLSGVAGAVFDCIRPVVTQGIHRSRAGVLGAEAKWKQTDGKPMARDVDGKPMANAKQDKDKDKDKYKEQVVKENTKRKFTPPTLEEVEAYNAERGSQVDCQRFVDFYTSKGWKVGREPMKDWRAAFRTWERNSRAETIKPSPKIPIAPQQRATIDDIERYKKLIAEM